MVIFFFYLTMLCSGEAIAVNSNFTCHLNWNVSNSDELCVTMNSVHGMEKKWWKYATQACQWWWRKKMRCGSRICDEQSEHSFLLFVRRQSRLRFFSFSLTFSLSLLIAIEVRFFLSSIWFAYVPSTMFIFKEYSVRMWQKQKKIMQKIAWVTFMKYVRVFLHSNDK